MLWTCARGHEWTATADAIKRGCWCPECGGSQRLTIEVLQRHAQQKQGRCLSTRYRNNRDRLEWECAAGHRWFARVQDIRQGKWCPECGGSRKKTIGEMKAEAKKRGGRCISHEYRNSKAPLDWKCGKGHQWSAPWDVIAMGHWCPHCAGNARHSLDTMKSLAASRGGACLSASYQNANTPLLWECAEGHRWEATYGSVFHQGTWCPRCHFFFAEELCRIAFEQIFAKPFPKARPEWLRSHRGHVMELDGYCRELNAAFEYHGEQHFGKTKYSPLSKLAKRVADDAWKEQQCKKQGVALFVITCKDDLTRLESLIEKQARLLKVDVSEAAFGRAIDFSQVYRHETRLMRMKQIASERGGKCLSDKYVNNSTKILWRCAKGHEWSQRPADIVAGRWCPTCRGVKRVTIEDARETARHRGGRCLSKRLTNTESKLVWECREKHRWAATVRDVRSGRWCPRCGRRRAADAIRGSLEECSALAKQRGGQCLSTRYVNNSEHLKWRCSLGHIWKACWSSVSNGGSWCPDCGVKRRADKQRGNLGECIAYAESRGGQCLSTRYVKSTEVMQWQCSCGHQWRARWGDLRFRSRWCPKCSRKAAAEKRKKTLRDCQRAASKNGGRCLSAEYVNSREPMEWQCERGHAWKATAGSIFYAGSWCPLCARKAAGASAR